MFGFKAPPAILGKKEASVETEAVIPKLTACYRMQISHFYLFTVFLIYISAFKHLQCKSWHIFYFNNSK